MYADGGFVSELYLRWLWELLKRSFSGTHMSNISTTHIHCCIVKPLHLHTFTLTCMSNTSTQIHTCIHSHSHACPIHRSTQIHCCIVKPLHWHTFTLTCMSNTSTQIHCCIVKPLNTCTHSQDENGVYRQCLPCLLSRPRGNKLMIARRLSHTA